MQIQEDEEEMRRRKRKGREKVNLITREGKKCGLLAGLSKCQTQLTLNCSHQENVRKYPLKSAHFNLLYDIILYKCHNTLCFLCYNIQLITS